MSSHVQANQPTYCDPATHHHHRATDQAGSSEQDDRMIICTTKQQVEQRTDSRTNTPPPLPLSHSQCKHPSTTTTKPQPMYTPPTTTTKPQPMHTHHMLSDGRWTSINTCLQFTDTNFKVSIDNLLLLRITLNSDDRFRLYAKAEVIRTCRTDVRC